MVAEELVSGEGWISDDSSFYGDSDEQERLLSLCEGFDPNKYWSLSKDLNTIIAATRTTPAPDLHNIYQGKFDAWQLGEPVSDFLQRLPPLTTPLSHCPWIWAANPHRSGQDRSGRVHVQDSLIPRGQQLLQQSQEERDKIRKVNSGAAITRVLRQESESLKQRIAELAAETNVLSGKWMLFPNLGDLDSVWRMVVEGTINNRLGSAAKVATDPGNPRERLICIYTKDFRDVDDVLRVLKELVATGLVDPRGRGIYYKSDAYTYLDISSNNAADYGLQASLYSSQKMLA